MEYSPPKLCRFLCPKNTLNTIEAREQEIVTHAENMQTFGLAGPQDGIIMRIGFLIVSNGIYGAALCPSRRLPPDDWRPSSHCIARTRQSAKGLRLKTTHLSSQEIEIMKSAGLDENLQPIPGPD